MNNSRRLHRHSEQRSVVIIMAACCFWLDVGVAVDKSDVLLRHTCELLPACRLNHPTRVSFLRHECQWIGADFVSGHGQSSALGAAAPSFILTGGLPSDRAHVP